MRNNLQANAIWNNLKMVTRIAIHLSTVLLVASTCVPASADKPSERPNIVYIISDDLGYGDLGCYGANIVKTPNLDKLAAQGCRFTNAHSTAAVCTPTRYALLTGRYAWREPNTGIARGDQSLLIQPGTTTIASVLKTAGYKTGVVGKWHLGLGSPPMTDYNIEIKPGPLEIGFDYAFVIPATGDRVPCVFVENRQVVGYDRADPIEVSFGAKIGNEPTGIDPDIKLKIQGGPGHKDTVINGIPRIGFMTGGKAARWVDEDIADVLTTKAVDFIESSKSSPFFLFYSTHDIHEPMVPHPRFRGTSECGWRGDVIHQLDWSVGQLMAALERNRLTENTLVIFTSDNGGAIKNTYDDGTNELHSKQPPNGVLRASKGSLYEGGHRVPFIARWPGNIAKESLSAELIGHVDALASFAAITDQKLDEQAGSDSFNVLPLWLGEKPEKPVRDHLVLQSNSPSPLALREGDWMLIERAGANRNDKAGKKSGNVVVVTSELYNLATDPSQTEDVATKETLRVKAMTARLKTIREAGRSR
ncbi:MAG TPA: arylsulfatase [Pirellula sp.]|nr:arylsulfatase [Pirellula sp.]